MGGIHSFRKNRRNFQDDSEKMVVQLSVSELEEIVRRSIETYMKELQPIQAEARDEIIDSNQICREFGISLPTLIRYRREGLIPFFNIGNRVRFKRQDVVNALKKIGGVIWKRDS